MIQLASLSSHYWSLPYVLFCRELFQNLVLNQQFPTPSSEKQNVIHSCWDRTVMLSGTKCAEASDLNLSPPVLPQVSFLPSQWRFTPTSISCLLFSWFYSLFLQTNFQIWDAQFKRFHYCFQLYFAWNLKHDYILLKLTLRRNPQCIIITSSLGRKIQKYCS